MEVYGAGGLAQSYNEVASTPQSESLPKSVCNLLKNCYDRRTRFHF